MNISQVVIVDDHPIVRAGLAAVIGQDPGLSLCAECGSDEEAVAIVRQQKPDLAIIDMTLGAASALPLFQRLLQYHPGLRMLALSMHDENIFGLRALKAGAHGYIMKGSDIHELLGAIHQVLDGQLFLSQQLRMQLLNNVVHGNPENTGNQLSQLTHAELVVLQMLGEGSSRREIAEKLSRSLKTIEAHCSNIRTKLNLKGAAALAHFAIQWVKHQ